MNLNHSLDLMLTNRVDKIASYQAGISNFSDHSLQILVRNTKEIIPVNNFLRFRSYKNFVKSDFQQNIISHPNYIEVLYEGDPERITELLQTIIKDSLEEMAPMRTIQVTPKNTPKLSENIKLIMVERDL